MFKARPHRFVIRHCMGWCLAGVSLSMLQPFLFNRPDAFGHGLDTLLALVFLLLPSSVASFPASIPRHRAPAERVSFPGGAPPPAHPWRRQPPRNAPPLAT